MIEYSATKGNTHFSLLQPGVDQHTSSTSTTDAHRLELSLKISALATMEKPARDLLLAKTGFTFPCLVSLGKQHCFGEELARMELFLFLTNIMQNFHFKSTQAPQDIDVSPRLVSFATIPPNYTEFLVPLSLGCMRLKGMIETRQVRG